MHILVVGLNFRTAPIAVREKFSLSDTAVRLCLDRLRNARNIYESVVVSTCNRTEIYAVAGSIASASQFVHSFLSEISGVDPETVRLHLYTREDDEAVLHLFRVAAGLDSMILGETQILGQVRHAYHLAFAAGNTGTIFNNLFRRAVTAAKRGHTETQIGKNAVSVSYAAVELARKIFQNIHEKTVLIIGAGKMSELAALHLKNFGVSRVLVVNRTYEKARELALRFQGKALDMDSLELALKEADIVISSTGATGYVVTRTQVGAIMRQRRKRPLLMIDIAVPRDLDPEINQLDHVYLYDIDDLEGVIASNMAEREREAEKLGEILQEELVSFKQWYNTLEVVPVITALREMGTQIQENVMESILNKLPDLDERARKVIHKHTMSIVNQLLREPILQLKELAAMPGGELYMEACKRLFGLETVPGGTEARETVALPGHHPDRESTEKDLKGSVERAQSGSGFAAPGSRKQAVALLWRQAGR
jgi:glutamyl-tRNA reductase